MYKLTRKAFTLGREAAIKVMIINEVKKARVETDYKKFNNKQLSRVHEKQNKVS